MLSNSPVSFVIASILSSEGILPFFDFSHGSKEKTRSSQAFLNVNFQYYNNLEF